MIKSLSIDSLEIYEGLLKDFIDTDEDDCFAFAKILNLESEVPICYNYQAGGRFLDGKGYQMEAEIF